tara:strand:- start:140 stop:1033 length:894 start_codon:yes stop_codon:yes gene_type:complete
MQNSSKKKYFIWFIQGGLGKNVAATALVKSIKKSYPDRELIIVCSWPQVFLNNPNIDRVYNANNIPHFYEDYIEGKDIIVCNQEPYNQTGHVTKQQHVLKSWCELLGIEYTNQQPQLFYNYAEQKKFQHQPSPKPVLLIHTGGGPTDDEVEYNWTRDIPMEFAASIVDKYSKTHNIIQVTRPKGYKLQHSSVKIIDTPMANLNLFSLLQNSNKRVLIDSCLQHAAAAMNLPSTVLWIGTSPTLFGYSQHQNIVAGLNKRANQLIDSTLFDYQFSQNEYQCPYMDVDEIFSQEVLNKI